MNVHECFGSAWVNGKKGGKFSIDWHQKMGESVEGGVSGNSASGGSIAWGWCAQITQIKPEPMSV